jgi:signal transduction histidine kinase
VVNACAICIGGRTYLLTLLNDISAIKKADTERMRLEKQLRQSQKMESLGTLAGGIAHDFNNILGVILGYGELALMELPDVQEHPLRQNVASLLKAVTRAKELVRQILTFSRQTEESRRPINVNTIVKETLKLLRSTLPTSIDIKQNIAGESNLVLGTPTQIQQVIMNLCTNALYAMGGNRGTLTVDIQPIDVVDKVVTGDMVAFKEMEPGPYLLITVRDTGHGISPGILERVFDPYFTTKQPGEGTGLGLSTVHGIIKNYKGNITINSQRGKGTEVKVWLPTLVAAEEPEEEEFQILPLGKEKILMVDDEEELLKSHRQILEQLNYSVVTCSCSIAALEIFRETPDDFDLIITDMSMPEMTGTQLTEEVFKIRPDIHIILCTGFSEFIDAKQAKTIGIKEFLMKPVDRQTLANIIRKVLDKG